MAVYKRALDAIGQKTIRCLKASDSGTVGLGRYPMGRAGNSGRRG